jgi:hypothetical protein
MSVMSRIYEALYFMKKNRRWCVRYIDWGVLFYIYIYINQYYYLSLYIKTSLVDN